MTVCVLATASAFLLLLRFHVKQTTDSSKPQYFARQQLESFNMYLLTSASSLSRSSSLALPDTVHAAAPVAPCGRANMARPRLPASIRTQRRSSRSLQIRAEHGQGRAAAVLANVKDSCSKFLGRYDPVTTGIGSLLVTGYCVVVHGQEVVEALNIAAFATVLGMVLQEVLFHNEGKPGNHA